MSTQPHSISTLAQTAPIAPQPDDSDPAPERQAELRAAYEANVSAGRPPYTDVQIRSRGEVMWILRERGWSGRYGAYTVKYVLKPRGQSAEPADLRRANLGHVCLGDVYLRRADLSDANLVFADLRGAHLTDANLAHADLGRGQLGRAELNYASLAGAHLREADLAAANLQYANLAGARFHKGDLRGTVLHGAQMDASTILSDAAFDVGTWLGDVSWNGVSLTRIDWDQVPRLGDEAGLALLPDVVGSNVIDSTAPFEVAGDTAQQRGFPAPARASRKQRTASYKDVSRAYQQLALVLQAQGLGEPAARYAYRAQVLQRKILWRQGKPGRWFFSLMLGTLAGYGYRLGRILLAYLMVVGIAAAAYWALGALGHGLPLAPHEAILVSITAFHGRVFSETFQVASPQAWVAAGEAIMGLVVEGIFIAMLTQRFFNK